MWHFAAGWTFYRRRRQAPFPALDNPLEVLEWMKGFGAALADDSAVYSHPSIQAALLDCGIDGDELEELLQAAEVIQEDEEWCRWPSVPIRGWGAANTLRDGPVAYRLPDAANDEMG